MSNNFKYYAPVPGDGKDGAREVVEWMGHRRLKYITPADVDLDSPAVMIRCFGGGNLVVIAADDTEAVSIPMYSGEYFYCVVKRVCAATTCTNILAFFV